MKRVFTLVLLAAATLPAFAQHAGHAGYGGQEAREVKALSAEELQGFLAGAGLGDARAAELNRFPGPMHVLELADQLGLTPEQRARTEALMQSHKAEARAIGAKLVEAERSLDTLFAKGRVEPVALAQAVQAAAVLRGEFRLSHLETHRKMTAMLSPAQVESYVRLRGYAATGGHGKHRGH